eukprot:9498371-Pyramimonas_sp.AAC.1
MAVWGPYLDGLAHVLAQDPRPQAHSAEAKSDLGGANQKRHIRPHGHHLRTQKHPKQGPIRVRLALNKPSYH